jgi:ABC-type phosphate/phosphonate transport system substrate-binding protein
VPFGGADHPYQVLLVPPATSSETGTALAAFLKDRTGLTFKVNIVQSNSDVLAALCSPTPTFGWVDGWTLFAAIEQGCGNVALRVKQGEATGVKSDMVVSVAGNVDSVATLRRPAVASRRDFCRLGSQDTVSWILPVVMLRAPGFNPLKDFRNIKDYSDASSIMQDVSDNKCIAAIPSGTLASYKANNVADITKTVKVFATSPELPFGALIVSPTVPRSVADQVVRQFADHTDQLKDLVTADALVQATNADFADAQKAFDTAGIRFDVMGQ